MAEGVKAEHLEIEMTEKVCDRVDPAIPDTWKNLQIHIRPYIAEKTLQKLNGFEAVFGELKTNGEIILGCYDRLIYILSNCDAPSERVVKTYQEEICKQLTGTEKKELESWIKRKTDKGSLNTKTKENLESEMVKKLNGEIGPGDRTWRKFKLRLGKLGLEKAEKEACSDFTEVFKLMKNSGKIVTGNYNNLKDTLKDIHAPCVKTIENCEQLIMKLAPQKVMFGKPESQEYKKDLDDTQDASLSLVIANCTKSVGCIISPEMKGTGFRVGNKYLMTCWHVIKPIVQDTKHENDKDVKFHNFKRLMRDDVYVEFEYMDDSDIQLRKRFVGNLPYYDNKLDVAILELKEEEGKPLPPAVVNFDYCKLDQEVHFIGYPGSETMKTDRVTMKTDRTLKIFDRNAEIRKEIIDQNEWCYSQYSCPGYRFLYDENKIIFDCRFKYGASGSPGMTVAKGSNDPVVVLMLQGGVPNMADPRLIANAEDFPDYYRKEIGIGMNTIYLDMMQTPGLDNLRREIFKEKRFTSQ